MLHIDLPTRNDIQRLSQARGNNLISIYLPTTPVTQDAQADRIALKNLAGEALAQVKNAGRGEAEQIEDLLMALVEDDDFWAHQAHSLAIFATAQGVVTYRLPNRLSAAIEVSDRYLVKPLLRAATVPQAAYVLALSQNQAKLIEVSGDAVVAVKVPGMPDDAHAVLSQVAAQKGGLTGRLQGEGGVKVRLAQYARRVDQALRQHLGNSEVPLILAATEPLLGIYRSVQSYGHLADGALPGNPDATSDADLGLQARKVLDGLFASRLGQIRDTFAAREKESRASTDLAVIAKAATYGAVSELLVCIDSVQPGNIDANGTVSFAASAGADSHDVVDAITGLALATGAHVLAVRAEDIPGGANAAAVLRFPLS